MKKEGTKYLEGEYLYDWPPLAKIRIVSDGKPRNTHVYDQSTGREIHRISKMTIEADAGDDLLKARLEMNLLNLDVEAYIEEIVIGGITYKAIKE